MTDWDYYPSNRNKMSLKKLKARPLLLWNWDKPGPENLPEIVDWAFDNGIQFQHISDEKYQEIEKIILDWLDEQILELKSVSRLPILRPLSSKEKENE